MTALTTALRRALAQPDTRADAAPATAEAAWRRLLLPVLWLAAAGGLAALLLGPRSPTGAWLGQVESHLHVLPAPEAGVIAEVAAAPGEAVAAGGLLLRLDDGDLAPVLTALRAEAAVLDGLITAERRQAEVEDARWAGDQAAQRERLAQTLAGLRDDLARRRTEQAADSAEAAALDRDLARLVQADAALLVRPGEVAGLRQRYAALRAAIVQREGELTAAEARLTALERLAAAGPSAAPSGATPGRGQAAARRAEVATTIAELEATLVRRRLHAPAAGAVVQVLVRPGDRVCADAPLLSVQEGAADLVQAYIPATVSDAPPAPGARVSVQPLHRRAAAAGGVVTALSPGQVPLPLELLIGTVPLVARQVVIRLDPGHGLLPGERVQVSPVTDGR